MTVSGKESGKSGKAGMGRDVESMLYMCALIHEGYYNIRITWGEVRRLFSFAVENDPYEVCQELENQGYIESYDDQAPFMIIRRIHIRLSQERENDLMSRFFDVLKAVPLAFNVALVSYLQKNLIMGIIGSFYDHELDFASTPEERVLISAVTSDRFMDNDIASENIEEIIRKRRDEEKNLDAYTEQPWFNELLVIIKNGYYGNGSFNYIDTLESAYRVEFTAGVLELIKSGELFWLVVNFRDFIKRPEIDGRVKKFVSKKREERKINRLYDWLSIGNDFAVGVEFVVGSIEFLPGEHSTFGVYLFIVGSSQLLIRPIISLSRKIHLRALVKRKIRF